MQRGYLRVLEDMRYFIDLSSSEELKAMLGGRDIIQG